MDCGEGCVDANVAKPVDDVANATPIGLNCVGLRRCQWRQTRWWCCQCVANRNVLLWGCVDGNVANPVDNVANASPITMDCVWRCRWQCRQSRWRCSQCVVNRNGLSWWLRWCQCRILCWRCRQCIANRNGLCRAASMPMSPTPLTMLPMRRQ